MINPPYTLMPLYDVCYIVHKQLALSAADSVFFLRIDAQGKITKCKEIG